mmetsp:Transcript_89614/g.161636  ORF Transcript_89614/g.161636 Transcript_89614/m.161636 type:complete len:238 (+) Transcript_89614:1-714(+)
MEAGGEWSAAPTDPNRAVFICDLAPKLTEQDLRQVFGFYGNIVSLEHGDEVAGGAAAIWYQTAEEAAEAKSTVHLALMRGKISRVLLMSALEVIWGTMEAGNRLVIEGLDLSIESQGLQDVCTLFGTVLDCKVQLDAQGQSRGYGFVHFAAKEEASKAQSLLNKMQIGNSSVEVRLFTAKDAVLFTGCTYTMPQPEDGFVPCVNSPRPGATSGDAQWMNLGAYQGWDDDNNEADEKW